MTNNSESCPTCGSYQTTFDPTYGFYECTECKAVWTHSKDDPDYDEVEFIPDDWINLDLDLN